MTTTPSRPTVTYPPDLPITARREELVQTIRNNQVVVVAGETGSGKSTQLPKLALEAGCGANGWIGHTQPRRIAARSVAERIAEELGSELGEWVGYKVRFTDHVGDATLIKLMTDGILLAELGRDRTLSGYDTVIVDEAHERSLNIDFLLGYLHRLLPKRPDLKVIITSATIDTQKFADHFSRADLNVPIIEVSGRSYPVEVRYRPLTEEPIDPGGTGRTLDQAEAVVEAARELIAEGPGDILAFFPGERDILEAADALGHARLPGVETLPLYARLSAAEQHRVFSSHKGRRIVLATNVAETSLTVPGIRSVIDTGTARISRFSNRTKVQRLPIEAISQASANQRSGRCGRLGPGIAIRLYAEEDFDSRAEFTEPEVLRTKLASVILQMASLRLGEAADYPFVDPPDSRQIADGIQLLVELGAVDPEAKGTRKWLTPMGRRISRLSVDPRMARMVLQAEREDCVDDVLVIAAGMSVIDPRERPPDKRGAADEHHARFAHDRSDFLTLLNLWNYLEEQRRERSRNQFTRMCKREFLNANRVREWRDIVAQLRRTAKSINLQLNADPYRDAHDRDEGAIHRSVLAGLITQIGMREGDSREYRGPRGMRFIVAPGSVQHPSNGGGATWLMAGELVETHRLHARMVAPIKPEWVEALAPGLVVRNYDEPWWDIDSEDAKATERVTMHGLPLVVDRKVSVARVNPETAREMLIHHAFIEGEWDRDYPFLSHNAAVLNELKALGARARRHDVGVDYQRLYDFYDQRLAPDIATVRAFHRWWNEVERSDPSRLELKLSDLTDITEDDIDTDAFPDRIAIGSVEAEVTYAFDPSIEADGVTVNIGVGQLNQAAQSSFDWNVPGLRRELVTELIRSLPKSLRKEFVPVPETVDALLPRLDPAQGTLVEVLAHELTANSGVPVSPEAFDTAKLPRHLRPTYRVVGDDDTTLAVGDDVRELAERLDAEVRKAVATTDDGLTRFDMTTWDCGEIPRQVERSAGGHTVVAFPALVDDATSVSLQLLANPAQQRASMIAGTRRLLALSLPNPAAALDRIADNELMLALEASPYRSRSEWFDDIYTAVLDHLIAEAGGAPWNEADYNTLRTHVRSGLADALWDTANHSRTVLIRHSGLRRKLRDMDNPAFATSIADARTQLGRLISPGFVAASGVDRIPDIDRYLRGVAMRLSRLASNTLRDLELTTTCVRLENDFDALAEGLRWSPELQDVSWMLEEFRLSSFAQELRAGVAGKVSEKRIRTAMRDLTRLDAS